MIGCACVVYHQLKVTLLPMLAHSYKLPTGLKYFTFYSVCTVYCAGGSFSFLIQVGVVTKNSCASGCTCTFIVSGAPDSILPSCRCVYACVCVCVCVCHCVCSTSLCYHYCIHVNVSLSGGSCPFTSTKWSGTLFVHVVC